MKRLLIGLVVSTFIVILSVQSVFAENIVSSALKSIFGAEEKVVVKLNGNIITFPDAQPFVDENSRTLVPIRFVAEAMGTDVKWEENGKVETVTLRKGNKTMDLKIGEYGATVNGQRRVLDTAAIMKEDRTFVPLRFVSEIMGAAVGWDESTNTVNITDSSITYTPTPMPTTSATPVVTPTPSTSTTPVKVDTNFDVSVDPICEDALNVPFYKSRVQSSDGSYSFSYYSISDKVNTRFTYLRNPRQFSIIMMWASENDYNVLSQLVNIACPDIHDEIMQMASERVGWQGENYRGSVGNYTVTIVHNSNGSIPKDEQGVSILVY